MVPSKIVSDALASAEQISRALSQSGYKADFSLESLKLIDSSRNRRRMDGQSQADFCLNNWVHVYLQLVPTLARSFVVRMEATGRGTTMTLKPRSILPFALTPE
jgi:hypothetical protein